MNINDIDWGNVPDWVATIAFVTIAVELLLDPNRPHFGKKPETDDAVPRGVRACGCVGTVLLLGVGSCTSAHAARSDHTHRRDPDDLTALPRGGRVRPTGRSKSSPAHEPPSGGRRVDSWPDSDPKPNRQPGWAHLGGEAEERTKTG